MVIFFFTGRIPVPNGMACDHMEGLTCSDCEIYYDPRWGYGDNENGKCVWVPHEEKCFPNLWATGGAPYNDWIIDEVCNDGEFKHKNCYMLLKKQIFFV